MHCFDLDNSTEQYNPGAEIPFYMTSNDLEPDGKGHRKDKPYLHQGQGHTKPRHSIGQISPRHDTSNNVWHDKRYCTSGEKLKPGKSGVTKNDTQLDSDTGKAGQNEGIFQPMI